MSEPELAPDHWLAFPKECQSVDRANGSESTGVSVPIQLVESSLSKQATALQGSPVQSIVPSEALDEAKLEAFADDAEALRHIRYLIERVRNLERALDQTIASYEELRQQLKDRSVLEQQLVATEEYSQLQQHEIERLRGQLQEQQPQQVSVLEDKLREAWNRVAGLEVQLDEARQQIVRLCENLTDRQANLARSEAQLEQMQQALHQDDKAPPKPSQSPVGTSTIASLLQELLKAQARIKALENQMSHQHQHQELMQQAYQDLESEHLSIRDSLVEYDPSRTQEMEARVGDLQEQILMQQQQLEESETAIQHWKDRYITSQQQACLLKELLVKHLPPTLTPELAVLLEAIQPVDAQNLDPNPRVLPWSKRKPKIELPAFLTQPRSQPLRKS